MFWSKLCKSSWNCAWNLAFPVFISPIVWNMCENLHYESVYSKSYTTSKKTQYWPTIYRTGAAVASTITSILLTCPFDGLLTWIINGRMTVDSYEVVSDSQLTRFCVEGFKTSTLTGFLDSKGTQHREGGGVPPYKRLIGMCRLTGSHFHDRSDYNGVAFSIDLLEWGRKFSHFWDR